MVNGNYVVYGDRPSSESEIVDDHVHTRTVDRKNKRKANRTANDLQRTLNLAQLDNETDSVKCEKKIKEPRLLRYVPTTDVEENFVSEKFETYDLKPTEEYPRRYAFNKKPKNPSDGSVNYAYSRSSSSCSSPNGNLPTISEHGEQYGTYRVRSVPSPIVDDLMIGYESKLEKYFTKPREGKPFAAKGSHPDSLYRVAADGSAGAGKMARVLRMLRWPVALFTVCIALAVFVYFLMPDNMESSSDTLKATFFEPVVVGEPTHRINQSTQTPEPVQKHKKNADNTRSTKTSEIDFYDTENDKNYDLLTVIGTIAETNPQRKLPIPPIFPTHLTPEVQYGNERADSENQRTPKVLEKTDQTLDDSTLKPHITQKPEKPLAIYFTGDSDATSTSTTSTTESITRAETVNGFTNFNEKQTTRKVEDSPVKTHPSAYKEYAAPVVVDHAPSLQEEIQSHIKHIEAVPDMPPELQEFYARRPVDPLFTSGHSKLFGISIEDAGKMKSTTQSSLYNTRVSPTLPTWRDADDATTKKYPTNVYTEVPQCGSTRLALCRGVLPYDLAGSAAIVSGVEVTSFMPQIEYLVATNCSDRVRHFVCALLEPECSPPPYPPKTPCYNLCKAIIDSCDGQIPRELIPAFNCEQYARSSCVSAKAPCYEREFTCGDGTCVPRDWICDGTKDCSNGEDEVSCVQCDRNEFRCRSGGCILKRWLCDGYTDCPDGEDEDEVGCGGPGDGRVEPGEEAAGSAPAPSVRRPNRLHGGHHRNPDIHRTGENDSSKELLVTSDTSNSFKRNFTRRPSPSRLSPYTRPISRVSVNNVTKEGTNEQNKKAPSTKTESEKTTSKSILENESVEDINLGDLGFFDEFEKEVKEQKSTSTKPAQGKVQHRQWLPTAPAPGQKSAAPLPPSASTQLNKSNKFEKVIDGASLLRKATKENAEAEEKDESNEQNGTFVDKEEYPGSAHASPCPNGELRCVDGRCITLAQLCDGTIDCSDHADEDNCYT